MTEQERIALARRMARTGEGRAIRRAADMPTRAVAAFVGVSRNTVVRWEAGSRAPSGRRAVAYMDLLERVLEGEL